VISGKTDGAKMPPLVFVDLLPKFVVEDSRLDFHSTEARLKIY